MTEANNIFAPTTPDPVVEPVVKPSDTTPEPVKVDHLAEIEQLVSSLHNVSPSGAETIRDQIMMRIGAIRDPKTWDERVAREKKAEDDAEVARKKAREDAKAAAAAAKAA